jgi:hypothetical protein
MYAHFICPDLDIEVNDYIVAFHLSRIYTIWRHKQYTHM